MPMSELEVFVANVELWKTRDRFKFIKIMNISQHGNGGTKEILVNIESKLYM